MKGILETSLATLATNKSWGKKELMRALLHKKGWFLKAKGTQPKDFQSERNKQGK